MHEREHQKLTYFFAVLRYMTFAYILSKKCLDSLRIGDKLLLLSLLRAQSPFEHCQHVQCNQYSIKDLWNLIFLRSKMRERVNKIYFYSESITVCLLVIVLVITITDIFYFSWVSILILGAATTHGRQTSKQSSKVKFPHSLGIQVGFYIP